MRHNGLGIEKRLGILPGRSFTLLITEIDAAVLYGRSFTLLTTEIDAAVLYGRSFTLLTTTATARLTAAEQTVFQQTAALPRLDQNAANFGLGNGTVDFALCARPKREFFEGPPACSKQPNDPAGQAGGISVDSKEIDAAVLYGRSFTLLTTMAGHG